MIFLKSFGAVFFLSIAVYLTLTYNIKEGLKIAEKFSDYYLVSKAYRHLSGTFLKEVRILNRDDEQRNEIIRECTKYYKKAVSESDNISDGYEKKRLKAYLKYLHGNILYVQGKCFEAMEEYKSAKFEFEKINDWGSAVKLYFAMAEVYELQSDKGRAIDTYIHGFNEAERIGRYDQILKNGVRICGLIKGNNEEYNKFYSKTKQIAKQVSNQKILDELELINYC